MVQPALSSRYRVLDSIRRRGAISRVEIAKATGLSRSAVTGLTQNLIDIGWIHEQPAIEANGATRGRPRVMLEINPKTACVLGVKLSLHLMSCAITDFRGDTLHSMSIPFGAEQRPDVAADLIEMGVRRCLADAGLEDDQVVGLGVGIPGYVSHDTGMCHWSPIFDRNNVPFGQLLSERFSFPSLIENDANLITLAEHWFGKGREMTSFAVVTIEHGIGMGLITHDRLYRGSNGIGPEFGHSKIEYNGRLCRCGQKGCIEAYASDYAILREVMPNFSLDSYNQSPQLFHDEIERVTQAAHAGDEALVSVFESAGRRLGRALGNIIATLNPPAIIVTGEGVRAGEIMFGPMKEEARALQLSDNQFDTEIIVHRWGDDVWARGAAAMVLHRQYSDDNGGKIFQTDQVRLMMTYDRSACINTC